MTEVAERAATAVTAQVTGHVAAVTAVTAGSEVTVDAAVGAMALAVWDVANFDEDGGWVRVADPEAADDEPRLVLAYTGVVEDDVAAIFDDGADVGEPGSLTLAEPLTAAVPVESRVDVLDGPDGAPVTEWVADVADDLGGGSIAATVPHELVDRLGDHVRGFVGESVVCVRHAGDDEWLLARLVGKDVEVFIGEVAEDARTAQQKADAAEAAALEAAGLAAGSGGVVYDDVAPPAATVTNLMLDPSFEYGIGNWNVDPATLDTSRARSGSQALRMTSGSERALFTGLAPDTVYTGAFWFFNPASSGGSGVRIRPFGGVVDNSLSPYDDTRDQWTQLQITFTTTADPTNVFLYAYQYGTEAWFDDTGVAAGESAVDFSGDTADTASTIHEWTATPGDSASTATTAGVEHTLWIDTSPVSETNPKPRNHPHRYVAGQGWVAVTDQAALDAADAAAKAQADATQALADAAAAKQVADSAAASAVAAQGTADNALTAAQAAQATADGAIRTWYDEEPPWPAGADRPDSDLGDMWLKPSTQTAHRWSGTDWPVIEDNAIAQALAAAQNAQTTADGKITGWYLPGPPWPDGDTGHDEDFGDTWHDTDDKNAPYYWATSRRWTSIRDETIAVAQAEAEAAAQAAQEAKDAAAGKVDAPTEPPAVSPTPTVRSGSGMVVVAWEPTADAAGYTLHRAAPSDVDAEGNPSPPTAPPGPEDVQVVDAHSPTWDSAPTEGAFYALTARNAVGAAVPSAWVFGTPGPIAQDVLTASLGLVRNVVAELVETAGIQIGTGSWTAEDGIEIPDVLHFPVDGSQNAQLIAALVAQSITIQNYLSVRGRLNQIEAGSRVTLATGVTTPNPETLSAAPYWPTSALVTGETIDMGSEGEPYQVVQDPSNPDRYVGVTRYVDGNTRLLEYVGGQRGTSSPLNDLSVPALCATPNRFWLTGRFGDRWYVAEFRNDLSFVAYHNVADGGVFQPGRGQPVCVPYPDGRDAFWVFGYKGDGAVWEHTYDGEGWGWNAYGNRCSGGGINNHRDWGAGVRGFVPGFQGEGTVLFPADGSDGYVLDINNDVQGRVRTPTRRTYGAAYDNGDELKTLDEFGLWHHFTTEAWNHDVAYTWYDGDTAGTGTHESLPSERVRVSLPAGAQARVQVPAAADTGEPDSPDRHRVYAAPPGGPLVLQGTTAPTSAPTYSFTLERYLDTGVAAPTASDFEAAAPAEIVSSASDAKGPLVYIPGDGTWRLDPAGNRDDTGPIDLPLAAGYVANAATEIPQYQRVGNVLWLSGIVKRTSGNFANDDIHVIATLPEKFRPATNRMLPADTSSATGDRNARVQLAPDGRVIVRSDNAAYVALDVAPVLLPLT